MYKQTIRRNFSRHAMEYDKHAFVQRGCGNDLIERLKGRDLPRILEIGCGTGEYTRLLNAAFPDSSITALDICEEMVEAARVKLPEGRIDFVVSDCEGMDPGSEYDLVTSNSSLQWVRDIRGVLGAIRDMLSDNGMTCFTIYGPGTFSQLKAVIKWYFGDDIRMPSDNFHEREGIMSLLRGLFGVVISECKDIVIEYPSLFHLLTEIKRTGTRGEGLSDRFYLGRHAIERMEERYLGEYGKITATHQVFYFSAEK